MTDIAMLSGVINVMRGELLLGQLDGLCKRAGSDAGWGATLVAADGWDSVRPLFENEATLLGHAERWPDAWQDAWRDAQGPGVWLCAGGARAAVRMRVVGCAVTVWPGHSGA